MKKNTYLLLSFLIISSSLPAQVAITAQSTFGGVDFDVPADIVNGPDGGYYVLNYARSSASGNVTVTSFGEVDYVLVKYDVNHAIEWQRSYGGLDVDNPTDIYIINNNLFLLGTSNSPVSGNKSAVNHGGNDIWIVKTDLNGNIIWDKSFGGDQSDLLEAVNQLNNGNLLIASASLSGITGNKTTPNIGLVDYWIFELDENGDYVWEKTLGTDQVDQPKDIVFFENNIYVTGNSRGGANGDKTEPLYGFADYWVVKTDDSGNKIWDRAIGTNDPDMGFSQLYINTDSIQVFNTGSNPMSGMRTVTRKGTQDIWRVSLTHNGDVLSQKAYGGSQSEGLQGFLELNGNLLLMAASESDVSIDKTENSKGGWDFWPILLNQNGNIIWQKTIGASLSDIPARFITRSNEKLIVAMASTSPISGDKTTPNYGDRDTWIVELDITSLSNDKLAFQEFRIYPNPFQDNILVSGENLENIEKVEILDALGKVVSSNNFSSDLGKSTIFVSTSGIASGAYILNVTTTKVVQSYKVVK